LKLILLSTPIGNIADASDRLKTYLNDGVLFFVEDSRKFFQLLSLLDISKDNKLVIVFNDHKQSEIINNLKILSEHEYGCIVSDAGSPVMSDPAFPFIKEVIASEGEVYSVPGPSAVINALEVSGLPPAPFMFHGFLPRGENDIKNILEYLPSKVTHSFFESPNRIHKTLLYIHKHYPNCEVAVVRELSKKFESHHRFLGKDIPSVIEDIKAKGEFVLLLRHTNTIHSKKSFDAEKLAKQYMEKQSPKNLAKLIGQILDENVSELYEKLIRK
jgi:16S rRNA (cytidine1402-2'-O)-methyltransferase